MAPSARRAAFFPARVAARLWRGPLESAADEVVAGPGLARVLDRALAGSLPEELARSLVRHQVLERVVRELEATGELERLITQALGSRQALQLTDRVLESAEMQQALRRVASSPELREAMAVQSAGLAESVAAGARASAIRLDDRLGRRPAGAVYAGVASRGLALAVDALTVVGVWVVVSAVFALIASLVGGVHPHWLAGTLLGAGWVVLAGGYFVLFWSTTAQTPGMRLLHLRVSRPGGRLGLGRSVVRTIGLGLAIVPCFLGFLPALFDARRRALPDYLAGTVVVYEPRA